MITRESIYHIPKSNYSYAYHKDTLHIKIRTKVNECDEVDLIWGDPYNWIKVTEGEKEEHRWESETTPMKKVGSTKLFDYWFAAITPDRKRVRYGFFLKGATDCIFFGDNGVKETPKQKPLDDIAEYIAFPFMNEVDIFKGPEWVKDTVWYQIFPERFCNGNKDIDPEGALPWGSAEPTPDNFFGGDLEGVISKLDYLKDLGVSGLYFTPLFTSPTNHKYDTTDYMEIDPAFGTNKILKTLVEKAHKRGLKIMFDAVFNHAGWTFGPWQDVLKNGEKSRYKDWFYINQFPLFPEGIDPFNMPTSGEGDWKSLGYDTFAYTPFMPKFNTENKEVRDYLLEVSAYYAREFNIDAWRLDVANEISHDFWRDFRKVVKAVNEDLYIVGEVWHESSAWLGGDQFDSVMNYPLGNAIINYVAKETIPAVDFTNALVDQTHRYTQNINEVMFNLLDSHDTARLITQCGENKEKAKLALLLQLSQPGSPCIYYGTEVGLNGAHDPGCRKCMIWDEDKQDKAMFKHMQKLLHLRKDHGVIGTHGELKVIWSDNTTNAVIYNKVSVSSTVMYVINNCDKEQNIPLPTSVVGLNAFELYKDEKITLSESITLPAYGFGIIKLK